MRNKIKLHVYQLIKLISRRRTATALSIYVLSVLLSWSIWYAPFAKINTDDHNHLNAGHTLPTIKYSYSKLKFSYPKETSIIPSREDGSQLLLLLVIEESDDGNTNSIAIEVGKTMFNLNSSFMSKQIKIIFVKNETMARQRLNTFIEYYEEPTLAGIILSDSSKLEKNVDVRIDVLGPHMVRPALNIVTCLLQNCLILDIECSLVSDQQKRLDNVPLHWLLNKRKIESMTLQFNSGEYQVPSHNDGYTARRRFERQVQLYCGLVETQLRAISNMYGPLHDSTYSYLIPSKREHSNYNNRKEHLFVTAVDMMFGFLGFPIALLIASLPSVTNNALKRNSLRQCVYIFATSNIIFPFLTNSFGYWPVKSSIGYLFYIFTICVTLDITISGKWPDILPYQLCQLCAIYLTAFAINDYLGALQMAYAITPMMLSLESFNKWFQTGAILWCLSSYVKMSNLIVSRVYLTLFANVIAQAIAWMIRQ